MGQRDRRDKVRVRIDWAGLWAAEARRAALWVPVAMGAGVALYFALPAEPHWAVAAAALLPLGLLASGRPRRLGWGALVLVAGLAAGWTGFTAALLEARLVAAPVLAGPLEETVDGRVIARSRSASGAPRVLVDRLTIYGLPREETPGRVRVALIGTDLDAAPRPGARIRVYARLLPPGGPVEPGAFDFRRKAFFEGLGGVGYARGPVLDLGTAASAGARDAARLWLAGARMRLADGIRAALPGREGAFAAAIVTGDRSAIGEAEAEALRAANLSHLLAISGLHMGILTGLVFLALRLLFAAIPGLVLRYPVKKVAAAGALVAGAAYLAVAGATVATQRAFLMAAVVFVAVMLDRPAITLRALALAAVLVLLVHPVSLFDVGFQMSFAATTALVAGFEAFGRRGGRAAGRRPQGTAARIGRRIALYAGGVLVTSLVAGLATAPFAAFHFNRLAPYGLPANLAAVPVMGLWIAPAAILSALAAPFGLAEWPLALMGAGIGWVLAVAETVAGWPGAWRPVAAAPGAALLAIALGGLWLALWRSRVRLAGLAGLALGLGLWIGGTERPAVLLAPGARLVGVMGPEGRVVDHPRAQSYAAGTWLRRDGEPAPQEVAVARPGMAHGRGWARADLAGGWRLEVVHGRRPGRERLRALCREGVLLVARHGPPVDGPCRYLGERALDRGGAAAVRIGPEGPRITWSRDPTRRRPWLPAGEIPAR